MVSVIIPTFNRKALLQRALDSVFAQTFRDYEIIVVDDGSTDGTELLPVLASPPAAVQYIKLEKNSGVSHARNIGIAQSKGAWITFLDSDDQWLPSKLECQVAWTDQHPAFRIVQTRETWIRNGKKVNPPGTHIKVEGDIFRISLDRCMITPSSVMLQRSLLEETGGFNEAFPACEDYDLWLRTTCRYPVGLIDEELLIRYGGHIDQLSSTTKVLDKYRIESMVHLLGSGLLSPMQKQLTRDALVAKAKIVAAGCRKRNNEKEYEYFKNITEQFK